MQDPSLEQATEFLRQRRFAEAEAVCRRVLERAPRDAVALHMLGLVRKDVGDAEGGERLLRQSIEIEPRRAEFHANLANLMRRLGRLPEAESSYRAALGRDHRHRPARLGLARTLIDLGRHGDAEAECRALIESNGRNEQSWSALAMALRGQQRHAEAEAAYRRAIDLAPNYAVAHHNLGALLSEADRAEEALAELERAQSLGIRTREMAVNRARTLFKLYRFEEAERAYAEALALEPLDLDAHLGLAELRYMRGDPLFARSIVAAAAARRDNIPLQMMLGDVLRRAGDLNGAEVLLRDILARIGPLPEVRSSLAIVLHETGRLQEAEIEALEAATALAQNVSVVENLVAIQLALGRPEEAAPFIRAQRARQPDEQRWIAYEATAARLMGHSLYHELYDYQRLVRAYDAEPPKGWSSMEELNAALVAALGARHQFTMHPLGQSLRNGSQTARSLLADADPAIQGILQAFRAPIEDYRARMGANPGHPLSARNSGETFMKGCWSVQLRREGFHVNHIHPEGWISSAYYVSVPQEIDDAGLMSGWLKFGEPRFSTPGAHPERFIQPRSGRLVLFPSYMWHGTNPIHGAESRLTIAFDAVPRPPAANP